MKFDFYLSEMSVTDSHGGGLTLQRVIGNQLNEIDYFVYVNRFATAYPTIPEIQDKVINLTSPWDSDIARLIIGRTRARNLSNNLSIIKLDALNAARTISKKFAESIGINGLICPQGLQSIYTLEALKKIRPVKYITWVMDDHLVKFENGQWTYPAETEAILQKHMQQAEKVVVISTGMQQFYLDRFNVKSTVLFGPADPSKKEKVSRHPSSSIKIGYFGAVAAWQMDALRAVAVALDKTNTQLDIYSVIDRLPDELCLEGVCFKGRLKQNEVVKTMQNYDALLLPISFLEKMRNMSEFNTATKMSEYLASGIPIFAIGPPYASMIKYLKLHNAAIVVDSNDFLDIKNAFAQISNPEIVDVILRNAQQRVVVETGISPTRKRWHDLLS